jgi:hypothetical protein
MLRIAGIALLGVLVAGSASAQGGRIRLLGAIEGRVRNAAGIPQPGAIVLLQNNNERVVARTQTAVDGRFRFDSLTPENYSVRVWSSAFVPANRQNVPVRAGMESMLSVQLASFFSSIELVSTTPAAGGLVSDDWKWVLRSNPGLRPVLRYSAPRVSAGAAGRDWPVPDGWRKTRGVVQISGGESSSDLMGTSSDLGTAFALATSVFGTRELQFSGNVGYAAASGNPASAFRTRYTGLAGGSASPDVEFTVRQFGLRQRVGQALVTGPGAAQDLPLLRSYSVKLQDRQEIGDRMRLDYGLMMEAVAFVDHLNVLSPFAKLDYDISRNSGLQLAFSSGAPGASLSPQAVTPSQSESLAGLNMFPRISLVGGQTRMQRSTSYEAGYRLNLGLTKLSASVYRERMSNQAFVLAGDTSALQAKDLLPDMASNSSIFNFGNFESSGYVVSATRPLGDRVSVSGIYGSGGALRPDNSGAVVGDASALRDRMRLGQTKWAATKVNGKLPGAGTTISMAYVWTPGGRLIPTHAFLTQDFQTGLGLNFQIRQPLPIINAFGGRFEMTAEVRNLLAQGYVPVPSTDGRAMVLVPFPRSLRGGVSFIF